MDRRADEIVVVLSHLPWDFPWDCVKQTSLELAKRAKVVFFNPLYPPTLKNLLTDKAKRKDWLTLFKQKEIIYFPSLALFPFQRIRFIEKLNIRLNLLLFRLFYRLKYGSQKPIFWFFFYGLVEIIDNFRWGKYLVYDRMDQVSSLDPVEDRQVRRKDRSLLEAANYVFTNSPYALRYIKKYNQQSFLVPDGFTISLFEKKKIRLPAELKKIKRPIIGLVGSIDHRLDFRIIYPLVKKRKEWSFIFVGSPFSGTLDQFRAADLQRWLAKLGRLPNVYFLGRKPKEQMPDFIASFDTCLIPYDVSQEFVKGCNPMKLYEYLATGKPVVSVPIEAVEEYSPTVKIAHNAAGFEKAIEECLKIKDNKREIRARKKIARDNSWEKQFRVMWGLIG